MKAHEYISAGLDAAKKTIDSLRCEIDAITDAAKMARRSLDSGGRIFFAGNGGSAADAQHAAAELVGRLGMGVDRPPMSAIALTTDTSALTALSNDFGFEQVFARQLRALGRSGDILFAISTSGGSANILEAARAARELDIKVIGFTGPESGELGSLSDVIIHSCGDNTPRIQEGHEVALHIICGLIESDIL